MWLCYEDPPFLPAEHWSLLAKPRVCMEDGTHAILTESGWEVFVESCLHPLPCPRHGAAPTEGPHE